MEIRPHKKHSSISKRPVKRSKDSRTHLAVTLVVGLIAILAFVAFSMRAVHVDASAPVQSGISETAAHQIDALIAEKESRTPAQQKIDSQLLYAAKMNRGEMIAEGIPTLQVNVTTDDSRKSDTNVGPLVDDSKPRSDSAGSDESRVIVDISASLGGTVLSDIKAVGGEILNAMPAYNSVRASLPLQKLEEIAANPQVRFIQPKQESVTSGGPAPPMAARPSPIGASLPAGFAGRAANVRAKLAGLLPNASQIHPFVGSQNAQGDTTHRAAAARATFGVNGSGVKIGVLSNGVVSLAASQALGDLGPVTVLPGQTGTGDEGTAMLEIIHDLAPGAQLFFATANTSIVSFAQNIRDLRTAGCDIIVDDVFYFVESPFQDGAPGPTNTNGGAVIQAVNDVVAGGAMYFSSAGNSGNKNDNTSGVWEGDFADGGASAAPLPLTGNVHNFGGQNFDVITVNGSQINLYWSDPLGGSSNDYDLFILNSTGTTVLASSTNIQNGTQDPFEVTGSGANLRVVVLEKTGAAARFLHVNSNRGRLSINTVGQTHGHAGATGAFGCAATPANLPFGAPPNPVGPFPNPFNSTNTVELFSSDGPRHIFYNANSSPITPGDVSSTGGTTLQKPDITAADGVSDTGVGGFPTTFYGTSAAAPHAGAIAGLIKSAGLFSNAQIRTALLSTAIDIEAAGTDRDSGAGIVMAFEALNSLGVSTQVANVDLGTITAVENPGDADGIIEAGEGGSLTVQLTNNGVVDAANVSATLTTSTPGVTITQPGVSAYPNIPSGGGTANNTTPYTFTLAPTFPCSGTLVFTLTVTYTGGPSPKVFSFSVNVGLPPSVITTTLDTTPPAAGTGFTATTGLQTPRITRANPTGACGATKAFPGVTGTGTRQFDAYSFTTCANTAPYCVTVTLTNNCTGNKQLFDAAYSGSFDPNNLGTNYLTDAAASNVVGGPITFSVTIPAGSTFVVVVADVNTGVDSAIGCSYTLRVSGACLSCQTNNLPPVAQCQNVTVSAGASCTANASINNGSSDPEGGPLTITQSPAGPYPVGTTSVLLTVVDNKGATSQCTATVTVADTTPPSITCPANVTVSTAPGQCSAVVSYAAPTATDNCSTTVVSSPASGSSFPKGVTTVTATATDGAGNTATCTFTVTVNDTQPPVITCPANITVSTAPGQCSAVVTYAAPTATDNCPPTPTVVSSPASGSSFPKGVTTVNGTATDGAGNTATCTFTVTVNDTQPPVITCPANVTAVTPNGASSVIITYPAPVATDNCPGVTVVCSPASGSSVPLGTTTVSCTATDTSGNTATCSFTVAVFDICLQDDGGPTPVVLVNSATGDYRFCCGGTIYTGRGIVTSRGGAITVEHNTTTRRVLIKLDRASRQGTASYGSPPGQILCTIRDTNITNNSCMCQ